LVVPLIKVKITNGNEISSPIQQELREISGNTDQDIYSLVNASRAAFLLGDYKISKKLLSAMIMHRLSDYDKFEVAKGLFLDRNYYEARTLLGLLQQNYSDDVINSILSRIDEKIRTAETLKNEGKKLYKEKEYQAALLKYQAAIKEFPVYKSARIQYAYALKKIGNTDKAIKQLEMYELFEDIYPSEKPELHWKEVEKLKNSWREGK
jgi:tetratricopeptide (TPR) repeat protein